MSTDPQDGSQPTVVLVHGGFADGSGWQGVYNELRNEGRFSDEVMHPHRAARPCPRSVAPGDVGDSGSTNGLCPEILHVPASGPRSRLVGALHEFQQSSSRRASLAHIVVHKECHTPLRGPQRLFRT